jgi:DNA-binding response OmpR family regulator
MPRVLVAHPSRIVTRRLTAALRARRHEVSATNMMARAIPELTAFRPDIAIVGHDRPEETLSWCAELRDVNNTPVIALADRSCAGAFAALGIAQLLPVDVLRRPLSRAIHAVLREQRNRRQLRLHPTFRVGADAYGSLVGLVQVRGRMRLLTRTERAIFRLLMERQGEVVRYDLLAKAAWSQELTSDVPRARLRVHVHNIRQRLAELGPGGPTIELSLLNGYRLVWPAPDAVGETGARAA